MCYGLKSKDVHCLKLHLFYELSLVQGGNLAQECLVLLIFLLMITKEYKWTEGYSRCIAIRFGLKSRFRPKSTEVPGHLNKQFRSR